MRYLKDVVAKNLDPNPNSCIIYEVCAGSSTVTVVVTVIVMVGTVMTVVTTVEKAVVGMVAMEVTVLAEA